PGRHLLLPLRRPPDPDVRDPGGGGLTIRTLYRDAALADGRSARLEIGMSVLVQEGRILWIRPSGDEPDPLGPDLESVDADGPTLCAGRGHVVGPGGLPAPGAGGRRRGRGDPPGRGRPPVG